MSELQDILHSYTGKPLEIQGNSTDIFNMVSTNKPLSLSIKNSLEYGNCLEIWQKHLYIWLFLKLGSFAFLVSNNDWNFFEQEPKTGSNNSLNESLHKTKRYHGCQNADTFWALIHLPERKRKFQKEVDKCKLNQNNKDFGYWSNLLILRRQP